MPWPRWRTAPLEAAGMFGMFEAAEEEEEEEEEESWAGLALRLAPSAPQPRHRPSQASARYTLRRARAATALTWTRLPATP